jgi:DNA-binding NarL/FixJ family response regulator
VLTGILTPKQKRIVELLLAGCANQEIADQLGMTTRTVKAHFNRLFLLWQICGGHKRTKLAMMFAVPGTQTFRGHLTLRQQEALRLVAQGLKNEEIAARMGTTASVIKNRLRDVFDETGMSNRTELAIWFISHGG